MTQKKICLIIFVVLLGVLSLSLNRDRFAGQPIQISDRSVQPRDAMLRRSQDSAVNTVVFLLNRELELTSVKVIPVSAIETNKFALPIWELVSNSHSVPVKDFVYGMGIQGMKPAVKGAAAGPLEPGVKYRLLIQAGSHKVEHDFIPVPKSS